MKKKPTMRRTGVPFRSLLNPFEGKIRRWLKTGLTYAEMAEILAKDHGLKIHRDSINSYVLVRARGRGRTMLPADPETPEAISTPPSAHAGPQNGQEAAPGPKGKSGATGHGHMLPPQHSKYLDSRGQPAEPPPNPDDFRIENL